MQDITVRQMDFDVPEAIDPLIVPDDPEESYVAIGLSLLLPYLEPYLIRTMKEAKKQIEDPDLLSDLERFSAQEGQHYRQHMRFNEAIRSFGFPELRELEAELDADYRRFSEKKPLRWNLAYAEGFEALTTAFAHMSFQRGLNPCMDPHFENLFTWHLVEELEHRTVAFDVYQHVCGSYPYRLIFGTYAQWHMGRWIGRAASYMLRNDPRIESDFGGMQGVRARAREKRRMLAKELRPHLLKTYLPGYTPHDIEMTDAMRELADHYTQTAVRSS